MTENEKARSDAGTPEQANERASTDAAFINQSNIKRRGVQAFLLEGEANALPMRELARLVGEEDHRTRTKKRLNDPFVGQRVLFAVARLRAVRDTQIHTPGRCPNGHQQENDPRHEGQAKGT